MIGIILFLVWNGLMISSYGPDILFYAIFAYPVICAGVYLYHGGE
mgnify:CR=1 FL=1